jgi:hypothetical protein
VAWSGAWWQRFLLASAVAFGIVTPAVALARPSTHDDSAPAADTRDTSSASAGMNATTADEGTASMCESFDRQAAVQSTSQSDYQPGTSASAPSQASEHPYTQSHYQLGAGHQD